MKLSHIKQNVGFLENVYRKKTTAIFQTEMRLSYNNATIFFCKYVKIINPFKML